MTASSPLGLLQVVDTLDPRSDVAQYTLDIARLLGGAVFSLTDSSAVAEIPDDIPVFSPNRGEGTLSAWLRVLAEAAPTAVFVQHLGSASASLLLELSERDIPYVVFVHDYHALCPTRRLWHRRQDRCSGPGRWGGKCAWCISGMRQAAAWPWFAMRFRHRPQEWRNALVRARTLVASSFTLREFWIEQGAPPESVIVIPPVPLGPIPVQSIPRLKKRLDPPELFFPGGSGDDGDGLELLAAALDGVSDTVRISAYSRSDPKVEARLREAFAPRHELNILGNALAGGRGTQVALSDVVVVPSRWDQPFSRAVATAQALGVPAVATAMGGLPEQIVHGVNGYLAAPDDPSALADSLQECLADLRHPDQAFAWGGERVAAVARTQSQQTAARLHTLLELLGFGNEIGLEVEHGAWLREETGDTALTESQERLIAGLRMAALDIAPGPEERRWAQRAQVFTRRHLVQINHAIAFFRACGCKRLVWLGLPDADTVARLQAWGLELVPEDQLPDGLLVANPDPAQHLSTPGLDEKSLLRHRFPQALAWVELTPAGIETEAWND